MPEGADGGFAVVLDEHGVVHADDFEAQRGADEPNRAVHEPGDHGNLHAAPARELRTAQIEWRMGGGSACGRG